MIISETERLYLREMSGQDATNAYLLNIDPEVLKYTGDKPFESVQEARIFLEKYDHYKKYGFGRWAVILKSNHEFLGWCGLKYTETSNEFDIGFRLFKKHWNQGYATEVAKQCVQLGFSQFKMPQIVGRAMQQNTASINVLQKIGMQYLSPYDFQGEQGVIYALKNPNL